MSLVDILTLEPTESPFTFRASPTVAHKTPSGAIYGGQLVAQALVAAGAAVPPERLAHSVHAHFLSRASNDGAVDYVVTPLREGSSQTVMSVSAEQEGQRVFHLVASFSASSAGFAHQLHEVHAPLPDELPDSASLIESLDARSKAWLHALTTNFPIDIRFVGVPPRAALNRGEHVSVPVMTWMRSANPLPDSPLVHAAAAAYFSDLFLLATALARHGHWIGDPGIRAVSLDHSIWFHGPLRADDWLLFDREGLWSGEGRALSTGTLTDTDGRLIATVKQEGLIRYRPPTPETATESS